MSIFNKLNKNKLSGLFALMFVFAWFACSAHVNFSPETAHAGTLPDSHQSSPSHEGNMTEVCIDHAPSQNVTRHQDDSSNSPALISNATDQFINQLRIVSSFNDDPIRDRDPLSMRYSFLVYNKFLI
ncbi:MAG: hypothetical protein FGM57_03790 [Candidatus Taylorbacteria bacterium]|nr:hypothetical protein [Candidatus Taylorbacteria bacterium]